MENNYSGYQAPLPNATVILVLGIASIVTCCCSCIPGIICGIIAFVLANSASKLYHANPTAYTESSYKNVNAGKICAIIGLIFSVLGIISVIWSVSTYLGWDVLNDPELLQQRLEELMEQYPH
jgi:uncharacterized protein YacL